MEQWLTQTESVRPHDVMSALTLLSCLPRRESCGRTTQQVAGQCNAANQRLWQKPCPLQQYWKSQQEVYYFRH